MLFDDSVYQAAHAIVRRFQRSNNPPDAGLPKPCGLGWPNSVIIHILLNQLGKIA